MTELAALLRRSGLFEDLARHAFSLCARLDPGGSELVRLSAALAVQAVLDGHSCLDLRRHAGRDPFAARGEAGEGFVLPGLADWGAALAASPLVGSAAGATALVLDGERLYLRRYFDYEVRLAAELRARAALDGHAPQAVAGPLARLFPEGGKGLDWQKVGAATAALKRLCLIAGGPGTGKTHTVVRILLLLAELAGDEPLRIGLAAPTGKAASRLQEALRQAGEGLPQAAVFLAGVEARTIHRLLGTVRHSPYFRHQRQRRLALDVLIVDEVSMVDLAMMTKLVEAMPQEGRLILLGDKDQLASVEAGRVLADLYGEAPDGVSPAFASRLAVALGGEMAGIQIRVEAPPLADCLVRLTHSYRFRQEGGIGRLAAAVLAGEPDAALACLAAGDEVALRPAVSVGIGRRPDDERLAGVLLEAFAPLFAARQPEEALARLRRFQLLCAHRHGPYGSVHLNHWLEGVLERRGLILAGRPSAWYPGRPVMVTGNHYQLGLFNGDLGVTLAGEEGRLRVYFPRPEGGVRAVSPGRLPSHETAFALTVHKSQGSEFERVLLLLPETPSRLVSRELIYTAITRARRGFELWGGEEALREGIRRQVERDTGLGERVKNG